MVALTSNDSRGTALTGRCPPATSGCTSTIGIRPITYEKLPPPAGGEPAGAGTRVHDPSRCPVRSDHALRSLSVRAIRRFTIRPALPEPLAPLRGLMLNLRWSWHPETLDLFAAIDPAGWERAGREPAALLAEVSPERLASLADDRRFLRRLSEAVENLRGYNSGSRWYQSAPGLGGAPAGVAYFSPEYGTTAALPQYSGGLGILAGDHLKASSDLGVPLIGVGLLYRHGYFTQSLSAEGWQAERYPAGDPNGLPLALLREVTDRLYGGGSDHRLHQELLLGIGGVRAVRRFCELAGRPQPEVFHTNEGHAGFLGLERIRELTMS